MHTPFRSPPDIFKKSELAYDEGLVAEMEREIKRLKDANRTLQAKNKVLNDVASKQKDLAHRLAENLQWYIEEDETNIGQDGNEYWVNGKYRAQALIETYKAQTNLELQKPADESGAKTVGEELDDE